MSEQTEAQTIKDAVLEGVDPIILDKTKLYSVVVPEGAVREVLDLEEYADFPRRTRGTVELHTQDSFTYFVNEHKVAPATHLYADRDLYRFVAVFNDAYGDESGQGWGDHRAILGLRLTPEWKHWSSQDGKLLSQVEFAEHIELGALEIQSPSAAEALEIAQTFHAKKDVTFRQAHTLESGEQQFEYVENMTAGAGRAQDMTIPKEFVLGIAPFEGTQPYKVTARLRYRLSDGHLKIGYQLDRPHEILRSAFDDAVTFIGADTELTVLFGRRP